jgi:hypothetical protein
MPNLGFQGQFGGGFIAGPNGTLPPAAGPGVTYTYPFPRTTPRDRSGRKGPYVDIHGQNGLRMHRRSR